MREPTQTSNMLEAIDDAGAVSPKADSLPRIGPADAPERAPRGRLAFEIEIEEADT